MEWVYIYQNLEDGTIDYVGRSKSSRGCYQRIHDHRREKWRKGKLYRLYFCPCLNRAESEAIECEIIHKLKPAENKAKVGWGSIHADLPPLDELPHMDEGFCVGMGMSMITALDNIEKMILKKRKELGLDETDE